MPYTVRPDGEVHFNADPTFTVPNLGWACIECAPRPSQVIGELYNWYETDRKCGKAECWNMLTAGPHGNGWLHTRRGNFRLTAQWKWTTFAGKCVRCTRVFCGECFIGRGPVETWKADPDRPSRSFRARFELST